MPLTGTLKNNRRDKFGFWVFFFECCAITVKTITKSLFAKIFLEAIHFAIITKTLCIQKKLEKDHKNITKILVSDNCFVIISARMVRGRRVRKISLCWITKEKAKEGLWDF